MFENCHVAENNQRRHNRRRVFISLTTGSTCSAIAKGGTVTY